VSSCKAAEANEMAGLLGLEAPRYTSYPSAHHFSPQVNSEIHAAWLANIQKNTTISAYVHIPFCKELCWFCGCHTKMTKRYEPIAKYVRVLLQEIELIRKMAGGKGKLVNIHFGGGSPSLLEPNDWLSILYALASAFEFTPPGELAIELDPRTTTLENIEVYAKLGCNRASIGIQDFNPEVQQAINRIQPYAMVKTVVDQLRDAGIGEINCDLIYGLPHQTLYLFHRTLEKTLSIDPSRISLFSYAHMPQLKKHQRLIDESWLPNISDKLQLFVEASRMLEANGYVAVGMDHFAKPEDPMAIAMRNRSLRRNFQGYVVDDTDVLIGIGSSAISQFPEGYTQNSAHTPDYSTKVCSGMLPTVRGWANRSDDLARKKIIDALMCFMTVDLAEIADEFSLPLHHFDDSFDELRAFESKGILEVRGSRITLTTLYRMAARVVASAFDDYRSITPSKYSKVA
jgi:oxygen-independent coproporphyrinogen-3 oxidase